MEDFIDCEHCGQPMAKWRDFCPECRFDRRTGKVLRDEGAAVVAELAKAAERADEDAERRAVASIQRATGSGCGLIVWVLVGGAVLAGILFFPLQVIALSVVALAVWALFIRKA